MHATQVGVTRKPVGAPVADERAAHVRAVCITRSVNSEFTDSPEAWVRTASERVKAGPMTCGEDGSATSSRAVRQAGCAFQGNTHGAGLSDVNSCFRPPRGHGFAMSAGFGAPSAQGWAKGPPGRSAAKAYGRDGPDQGEMAGQMSTQGEENQMGAQEVVSAQAMVAEMLAAVRRMRLEAAVLIENVAELRNAAIPDSDPAARPGVRRLPA